MPTRQPPHRVTQQAAAAREPHRRPLTQYDAIFLGITDLASAIRRLRRKGAPIETVFTRRPSRYQPHGQRVALYVDTSRRYACGAIIAARRAREAAP